MPLIASSVTVVFMEQTAVCMPRTLTCAARTRSARASSLTVPSQPEQISSAAAQEASAPPPCPPRPSATTRQSPFSRRVMRTQSSFFTRPPMSV